jgi:hypothetical protein
MVFIYFFLHRGNENVDSGGCKQLVCLPQIPLSIFGHSHYDVMRDARIALFPRVHLDNKIDIIVKPSENIFHQ